MIDDTLSLYVEEPSGRRRIAHDEALALAAYDFSSTDPGGFATLDAQLVLPSTPIPPLTRHSPITLRSTDGTLAWQGRIQATPEESDDGTLTISGIGHAALLSDDPSIVFLGVLSDTSAWEEPSAAYIERVTEPAFGYVVNARLSAEVSEGGITIKMDVDRDVASKHRGIAWISLPSGTAVAEVQYLASKLSAPNMDLFLVVSTDVDGDPFVFANITADLTRQSYTPATPGRFVRITATPNSTVNKATQFVLRVHRVALYGDHGLPRYEVGTDLPQGLLYSDVIGHLAEQLGFATEITASNQPTPTAAWLEPTDLTQIIEEAIAYEANRTWAVWEGPTLHYRQRGELGRTWVYRRSEGTRVTGLGAASEAEFNQVMVTYTDDQGTLRRVGPVGSGADTEDDSLRDTNPANPVNAAGLTRTRLVEVGQPLRSEKAIEIGALALAEALEPQYAGELELPRECETEGRKLPTWMMRAGDKVIDGDDPDAPALPIAAMSYSNDASLPARASVDTSARTLEAALERLGARPRRFRRKRIEKHLAARRTRNRKIRRRAKKQHRQEAR